MQGQSVRLEAVSVSFDRMTAVQPTTLEIAAGEFFSILGPSGCGKTTMLRVVAGFQPPSAGRVFVGAEDVTGRPANRRPTAMIFQALALFPHMSVWENIAFGLEARGVGRRARRERADALLDLVGLADQAEKRPAQLSGGQRQRVAIARALAVDPAVLLLDEPLSALDLKLRQHMRLELRTIQKRTGVTFIYITHDQGEALTMSDRIAVMNKGRILQVGAPTSLYEEPSAAFVASFIGEQNRITGRVRSLSDGLARIDSALGPLLGRAGPGLRIGEAAELMVRPERVVIDLATEHDNRLTARLTHRSLEGATEICGFAAAGQTLSVLRLTARAALGEGDYALGFDARDAVIFPVDAPMDAPAA